jgi:hypothetical protein
MKSRPTEAQKNDRNHHQKPVETGLLAQLAQLGPKKPAAPGNARNPSKARRAFAAGLVLTCPRKRRADLASRNPWAPKERLR